MPMPTQAVCGVAKKSGGALAATASCATAAPATPARSPNTSIGRFTLELRIVSSVGRLSRPSDATQEIAKQFTPIASALFRRRVLAENARGLAHLQQTIDRRLRVFAKHQPLRDHVFHRSLDLLGID